MTEKCVIRAGDLTATLYLGDCLDILPMLGEVDITITDPPYDEKTHKGARHGFGATSSEIPFAHLKSFAFVPKLIEHTVQWVLCFCALEQYGDYKRAAGEAWVRAGFWRRTDGVPQFTGDRPGQPGEGIAIMHRPGKKKWNGGGSHGFWTCGIERDDQCHPTQKPIKLLQELVENFSSEGQTILDPFTGSGTTGIAALRQGRNFIGIEIEPKYYAIAKRRIQTEAAQHKLFT